MKEISVTTPHFIASTSSTTTRPSSQSIIMLTKACLLVAIRSAMRFESSIVNPFARQMSMTSFFSSFIRFYTSYISRASSDFMYWISALAERQSPSPMPIPSPTIAATQKARIFCGVSSEAMPVRMMMRVLMVPSSPPQTRDLSMSPASMWFSWCSLPPSLPSTKGSWILR